MLPALLPLLGPIIGKIIDKIPNSEAREKARFEATLEIQKAENQMLSLLSENDKNQAAINLEDAKSESLLKSGWRPVLGWVTVISFAWLVVVQPVVIFILVLTKGVAPTLPEFDTAILNTVLFGMLGLAVNRTVDKKLNK